MRSIKAYAIVQKKNPRLNTYDIYSTKDIGDVMIDDEEEVIEVTIAANK